MEEPAKYVPPHRYRGGRRGNDTTARGGSQRNPNTSRDTTPGSQQARKGGKVQQNVNKPASQQQQQPPPKPQPQQSLQPSKQQRATPPPSQPSQNRTQNGPAPQPEQHASLPGFSATEAQSFLSSGVATDIPTYKPEAAANTESRGGNPWAPKPNLMANNKDFWLELRRQVTALQKQKVSGNPPARGG